MSKQLQEAVGRMVRLARLARGLTQEELAELANLDRTYVSGLERGVRNPSLSTLERVARALDLPVHELLKEESRGVM